MVPPELRDAVLVAGDIGPAVLQVLRRDDVDVVLVVIQAPRAAPVRTAPVSCDIHTHTPARRKLCCQMSGFVEQICYTNCFGHGHGHY